MTGAVLRFLLLAAVKAASGLCFAFDARWVATPPARRWGDIRVALLLNHTSLFEPVFLALTPLSLLWRMARRGVLPGADSTLDRPVAGRFFRSLVPDAVAVTRRRDRSWSGFLERVDEACVVVMAPEGRMKRLSGLDKHGNPMTMRGGIADILARKTEGTMLLLYSGGLHHVQSPGERFPRLFKRVRVRLEEVEIARYKEELGAGSPGFRERVMADLERRRDAHCG